MRKFFGYEIPVCPTCGWARDAAGEAIVPPADLGFVIACNWCGNLFGNVVSVCPVCEWNRYDYVPRRRECKSCGQMTHKRFLSENVWCLKCIEEERYGHAQKRREKCKSCGQMTHKRFLSENVCCSKCTVEGGRLNSILID